VQAAEKKKSCCDDQSEKNIFNRTAPSTNPKALQINSLFVWLVDDSWLSRLTACSFGWWMIAGADLF
jgi:hypothetical protein